MSLPFEAGYRRFRSGRAKVLGEHFSSIADHCRSRALMVTCIDGRVDPAMIFDFAPGECMIVRVVGAMVPEPAQGSSTISSAVDLAVGQDGARDVIVLGHSRCRAAGWSVVDAPDAGLSSMLAEASVNVGGALDSRMIEKELVRLSVRNLGRYLGSSGIEVRFHGLWFDIGRARLEVVCG